MSRKLSLLNAIIVHRIEKTIIFKENLAYSKFFLYLCARNCKMGNCVTIGDQIFVLRDTINRQIKPWQISKFS